MEPLVALAHRRWALPALAELHRRRGAKFVTLESVLGASAGGLREGLRALVEAGLVMRNPGYGHPLRPEYVLTRRGASAGRAAERALTLLAGGARAAERPPAPGKWLLPVVLAVGARARRFGEVRGALPGVTDRALALALKEGAAAGLLARTVGDSWPSAPSYALTGTGRRLLPHLRALARAT